MAYYSPNWSNVTSIHNLVRLADDLTEHLLVFSFLLALFVIFLLVFNKNDFVDTLLVSGWTIFVLSLFAWYADFISAYYVLFFLIIAGLSMFAKFVIRK